MRIVLDGRASTEKAVLALGMFDGLHIGHRVLMRRAKAAAVQEGAALVACTFERHPLSILAPDQCPPSLTTFRERARLMAGLGVDILFALPFDRALMNLLPEEYIGELVRRFHPVEAVCGYNHRFGHNGTGTPEFLHALGHALGFHTSVVPKITLEGREVSSTVIRGLLGETGDVSLARKMLGRPYARGAQLAVSGGSVRFSDDGKQDVAPGSYRVLWDTEHSTLPAVVRVLSDGKGRICSAAIPGGEGTLRFLARQKP